MVMPLLILKINTLRKPIIITDIENPRHRNPQCIIPQAQIIKTMHLTTPIDPRIMDMHLHSMEEALLCLRLKRSSKKKNLVI